MDHDEKLFEAWESGVALGDAWWAFADNESKKLFHDRQVEGRSFHLEIQYTLEVDLIARLKEGSSKHMGLKRVATSDRNLSLNITFRRPPSWIM
jgi:hypothetical protein